ncbi:MAG: hypothetical protein Q9184_003415 [Pyrenodesmia sp. 2 TL-2023]
MAATHPPTLRILCFGASITAGFHHLGLSHHPYAKRLAQRLQTALPSSKITIDIDALSGDRVIGGQYSSRLKSHFGTTTSATKTDYDWLIFQGGGNDLGYGKEPTAIFKEMQKLWDGCVSGGAKVMALTVTETSDQSEGTRERYGKLNGLIRDFDGGEGVWVADVERKVPYGGMDPEVRRKVWDDGLHLKALGYDMIGDAVADGLLEVLKVEQSPREKL